MTINADKLHELDFSDIADGRLAPPTPGEILLKEYLEPMGITQYRVAKAISVPQTRIGEIVAGKRAITADTGLRLSRYFGLNDSFWMTLQANYDLSIARGELADTLAKIEPLAAA